jgi:hypothetical protein
VDEATAIGIFIAVFDSRITVRITGVEATLGTWQPGGSGLRGESVGYLGCHE